MRIRRILKTIAFLIFSYLLVDLRIREEGCWGPIQALYFMTLLFGVIITGIITLNVARRKIESEKIAFEPVTQTIVLLTISIIIFCKAGVEQIRGKTMLTAQSVYPSFPGLSHTLELRENGSYIAEVNFIEWTCTYPGRFTLFSDTVTLSTSVAELTDSNFVEKYLIVKDKLIPLINGVGYLDSMRRPGPLQILKRQ